MWEISENLHRADLTALERSEHVAEWVRLSEVGFAQHAQNPQGGRPGALSAATRSLGIDRTDAQRSIKVDSLSAEAKQAARDAGLADNRAALLYIIASTDVWSDFERVSNQREIAYVSLDTAHCSI